MANDPPGTTSREPTTTAATIGREEMTRTMLAFLAWLEQTKELRLCQAFKPQYDWYMPAYSDKGELAREFLHNRKAADCDKPNLEPPA
ncbi:MAG: hypothetical protein Q8O33_18080 [Pseudomonadota bacterium]|nr:hypothetical protein [Pseudomonadota bacterium]